MAIRKICVHNFYLKMPEHCCWRLCYLLSAQEYYLVWKKTLPTTQLGRTIRHNSAKSQCTFRVYVGRFITSWNYIVVNRSVECCASKMSSLRLPWITIRLLAVLLIAEGGDAQIPGWNRTEINFI